MYLWNSWDLWSFLVSTFTLRHLIFQRNFFCDVPSLIYFHIRTFSASFAMNSLTNNSKITHTWSHISTSQVCIRFNAIYHFPPRRILKTQFTTICNSWKLEVCMLKLAKHCKNFWQKFFGSNCTSQKSYFQKSFTLVLPHSFRNIPRLYLLSSRRN